MAYVNQYDNRKTIDLETGNFLTWEGGVGNIDGGALEERFTFYYQGIAVPFIAREEDICDDDNNYIGIHWEFSRVRTPYEMSEQDRTTIIAQIVEALKVFGYAYDNKDYRIISANYNPPIPWEP